MTDRYFSDELVWVGNTLLPRDLVFAVVGVVVLVALGLAYLIRAAYQRRH